jgi:hypothetical protein
MSENRPSKITAAHLQREAVVYLRQSTMQQVEQGLALDGQKSTCF